MRVKDNIRLSGVAAGHFIKRSSLGEMDVTRESMKTSRRAPATRGMGSMAAKAGWVWDVSCSVSSPGTLLQVLWPEAKVLALPPSGFLSSSPPELFRAALGLALLPRFRGLPLVFYQL